MKFWIKATIPPSLPKIGIFMENFGFFWPKNDIFSESFYFFLPKITFFETSQDFHKSQEKFSKKNILTHRHPPKNVHLSPLNLVPGYCMTVITMGKTIIDNINN
jgi:hypothetical protein